MSIIYKYGSMHLHKVVLGGPETISTSPFGFRDVLSSSRVRFAELLMPFLTLSTPGFTDGTFSYK